MTKISKLIFVANDFVLFAEFEYIFIFIADNYPDVIVDYNEKEKKLIIESSNLISFGTVLKIVRVFFKLILNEKA